MPFHVLGSWHTKISRLKQLIVSPCCSTTYTPLSSVITWTIFKKSTRPQKSPLPKRHWKTSCLVDWCHVLCLSLLTCIGTSTWFSHLFHLEGCFQTPGMLILSSPFLGGQIANKKIQCPSDQWQPFLHPVLQGRSKTLAWRSEAGILGILATC